MLDVGCSAAGFGVTCHQLYDGRLVMRQQNLFRFQLQCLCYCIDVGVPATKCYTITLRTAKSAQYKMRIKFKSDAMTVGKQMMLIFNLLEENGSFNTSHN
jgi:hypothetical protein